MISMYQNLTPRYIKRALSRFWGFLYFLAPSGGVYFCRPIVIFFKVSSSIILRLIIILLSTSGVNAFFYGSTQLFVIEFGTGRRFKGILGLLFTSFFYVFSVGFGSYSFQLFAFLWGEGLASLVFFLSALSLFSPESDLCIFIYSPTFTFSFERNYLKESDFWGPWLSSF